MEPTDYELIKRTQQLIDEKEHPTIVKSALFHTILEQLKIDRESYQLIKGIKYWDDRINDHVELLEQRLGIIN